MLGRRGGRHMTGSTDAQVCQVGGTAGAGCREGNGVIWIQWGGERRRELDVCQIR